MCENDAGCGPGLPLDGASVAVPASEIAGTEGVAAWNPVGSLVGNASLTVAPGPAAASAGRVYWSQEFGGDINGSALDGSAPFSASLAEPDYELVKYPPVTGFVDAVSAIAVGDVGPVYAATVGLGRMARDGSSYADTPWPWFISFCGAGINQQVQDVAVNGSYVYWVDSSENTGINALACPSPAPDGTVGRMNLDGSGIEPDLIDGGNWPGGYGPCSLAADASHLYWIGTDGAIGRSNLDGTGVDDTFITGSKVGAPAAYSGLGGLAADSSYLYWGGVDGISRAYVGDGTAAPGVTADFIKLGSYPLALAVNGSYVYWVNSAGTAIGRANIDGSGVDQNFITGLSGIAGFSLAASRPTPLLTLSAPSIAADGTSTSTATLTVTDQYGNAVSGDPVTITSSDPSQHVGPVSPGSAPGTYKATITSTTAPGTATIRAALQALVAALALAQLIPTLRAAEVLGHTGVAHQPLKQPHVPAAPRLQGDRRAHAAQPTRDEENRLVARPALRDATAALDGRRVEGGGW